ncbi:hypothetical protein FDJ28_gp30 [Pseudomonas phage Bjorn]|uniref:Uncharacterized protein n=1 Tax=Pseudomonas phage Bjorn TaxID=2079288 RepID=A0A2K9VHE0_9CAUD|nr:hypothetical protein FDJ28_gp30 [Pseudomonas phage Bjorn]AUV61776.1 hypothetical protein PsPhBjorn_gp40 [Pseudomonas phage Bjorn]
MTPSTIVGESMDRSNLVHAVNTLGAASRVLDRLSAYPNIAAEVKGIWKQLSQDLEAIREDERNARSNPNAAGGSLLGETQQPQRYCGKSESSILGTPNSGFGRGGPGDDGGGSQVWSS